MAPFRRRVQGDAEHVSERCVRHVWSCEACGYEFETSVYLRAEA